MKDLQQSLLSLLVMDLGYTDDEPPANGYHPIRHQMAWLDAVRDLDAATLKQEVAWLVQLMKDEA